MTIYNLSVELSNESWNLYASFDYEIKKIIGMQFIRAIDSIGANIAEGYGRFHYSDSIKFYYYSRGSIEESKHWIGLMTVRKIIDEDNYKKFSNNLVNLQKKLNNYIRYLRDKKGLNKDQSQIP